MSSPTVSVLMPVYNAERYVFEAVKSILGQTYSDFEFIIINDGSKDNSFQILKKFAKNDKRILLINRENKGLIASLNEMIEIARAPLIARMDADDIAYPDRFSKQVAFLNTHPTVVCAGGAFELIDERGRLLTRQHLPVEDSEIQRLNLAGHSAISHPCAMMRSESVRAVGGYAAIATYAEDLDLWLRLGEIGELANLPDCLLRYRIHAFSISQQQAEKQRLNAQHACQRAWQRRAIAGNFEATDHWRPSSSPISKHTFMLKYGWWAFFSRQRKTAAIYGLKAIKYYPLNKNGWILLFVSIFKPYPYRKHD